MMTRKSFLKTTSGAAALVAVAPLSALLEGCAPSAHTLHAPIEKNTVVIPRAGLPDLRAPNAYMKVYVDVYTNPFLLFMHTNGELRAVLSTCSHSGCEVAKRKNGFECPCHGSEYDLEGHVVKGPAPAPLDSYPVREFADRLEFMMEGQR